MNNKLDLAFWSKQTQNILEQQIKQTKYLKEISANLGYLNIFITAALIVTIIRGCK